MTRRLLTIGQNNRIDFKAFLDGEEDCALLNQADDTWGSYKSIAPYKVDEELWIAQSYKTLGYEPDDLIENVEGGMQYAYELAGYNNKMFVRSIYLEHRIRIKEIRLERVQDISDEDCMKEGIYKYNALPDADGMDRYNFIAYSYDATPGKHHKRWWFNNPRDAFHALINKTCGKDTWINNPWVWVYSFELIY
jgi:hypothetical protein